MRPGPPDNHLGDLRRQLPTTLTSSIREFVARTPSTATLAGAAAALASLGAYAYWIEPFWLDVTRTTIDLPGLPPPLDGMVLAHLSDLHVTGPAGPGNAAAKAVAICNQVRPDAVVLTGDYVGKRPGIDAFFDLLAALRVRPAYAVFGNHDYRYGPTHRRRLAAKLPELGVTLLDNRAVSHERAGGRIWFVGVGDGHTSHDRLGDALRGLGEADRPRVLLTHYPDLLFELPPDTCDLALAGHSHGAQIALPFLAERALAGSDTVFRHGLYHVHGVPLYVSRGLGTSGYRVRLFARPELALITLRSTGRPG
jgi:uncharacterized protein